MSLHITIYGPQHRFWRDRWSAWFFRPCEHSSGGVGFKVPFLHVALHWGMR